MPLERNDFKCCARQSRFVWTYEFIFVVVASTNESNPFCEIAKKCERRKKNTECDLSSALNTQFIFFFVFFTVLSRAIEEEKDVYTFFCIHFLLIWGQAITSINEIKMKRFGKNYRNEELIDWRPKHFKRIYLFTEIEFIEIEKHESSCCCDRIFS